MDHPLAHFPLTRRRLVGTATGAAALTLIGRPLATTAQDATPATPLIASPVPPDPGNVAIDLPIEPTTLDPALTYDANGWSVIHSLYDSLVGYDTDGTLRPLLAESWDVSDPLALTFRLRPDVTFHDGSPLTAADVVATVAHMQDPNTASQAAGNFAVVTATTAVDDLTVRLTLASPAPYLLAQIAAYLAIVPASALTGGADLSAAPVGTGPYRFDGWDRGRELRLVANSDYASGSIKGWPLAETATFRFVNDPSTRVADLLSESAGIVRDVTVDDITTVGASDTASIVVAPVSGLLFVRIATDTAPFDDPRVRRALNLAVDVDGIVAALVGGSGQRLATLLDPTSLGDDPSLSPYAYDPDRAIELLAEAGLGGGFETALEVTTSDSQVIAQAIAGQLAMVGITVTVSVVERAEFDATYADTAAAPLRMVTWTPMFDPYSLLGLVIASDGFLSRYANPAADALIATGATATDPSDRADAYRQLGTLLHDDPPAIFLYNLTARYGVANTVSGWKPRPDEYILPVRR